MKIFLIVAMTAIVAQRASGSPSCTLTPNGVNYAGSSRTGGYRVNSGYTVTAVCTGSGGITYAWTQTAGTNTLILAGASTTTVSATGNAAFSTVSDVLDLAATDSMGTSHTTVAMGTVPTNTSGVVDFTAEVGATNGAKLQKLIGPLYVADGTQPWPWYEDRMAYAIDLQIANRATYYKGFWYTPQPGTITVTGSSATITGSGTAFKPGAGGVCNGGSDSRDGGFIWWRYTGTDGLTHFTQRDMLHSAGGCVNNTTIVLNEAYPSNATITGGSYTLALCNAGCASLQWGWGWSGDGSTEGYSTVWGYAPAPANYYDNAVAFYLLYYRTGLDVYLTAARSLADDWWQQPAIDQGNSCHFGGAWQVCFFGNRQSFSMMGVFLRALDGGTSIYTGLRTAMCPAFTTFAVTLNASNGQIDDIRAQAYMQAYLAACAITETSAPTQATYQASLVAGLPTWQGYQQSNGGFVQFYTGGSSTSIGNAATVAATASLAAVTFTGFSCPDSSANANPPGAWYYWTWSGTATTQPAYGAVGNDAVYYKVTCNGTTAATISPVYQGTTGSGKGFALSVGIPYVSWGCQPFMCGLLDDSFWLSARALEGYMGNVGRDGYRTMGTSLATWLRDYAPNVSDKGTYSGVFAVCGHPIPATDLMCGTYMLDNDQQRETLNAEIVRALGLRYADDLEAVTKTAAQTLMTQMFCKAGTNCAFTANPDYIADLNNGGMYVSGTPPTGTAPKWTGQFFGYPESGSTVPALLATVPSTPAGLTAIGGNTQVSLSWGVTNGADTYNVYRGLTPGGEGGTPIVTGLVSPAYVNTGLTNGLTYYYKVSAVNTFGESGLSNEAFATPAVAPIGVTAFGGRTALGGKLAAGAH